MPPRLRTPPAMFTTAAAAPGDVAVAAIAGAPIWSAVAGTAFGRVGEVIWSNRPLPITVPWTTRP